MKENISINNGHNGNDMYKHISSTRSIYFAFIHGIHITVPIKLNLKIH